VAFKNQYCILKTSIFVKFQAATASGNGLPSVSQSPSMSQYLTKLATSEPVGHSNSVGMTSQPAVVAQMPVAAAAYATPVFPPRVDQDQAWYVSADLNSIYFLLNT
jgi:ApbE superfamily uncharacterized protein (UPF0280 family)